MDKSADLGRLRADVRREFADGFCVNRAGFGSGGGAHGQSFHRSYWNGNIEGHGGQQAGAKGRFFAQKGVLAPP